MSGMLLVIRQGKTLYALPAEKLRAVQPCGALSPLPCQPKWLLGIASYKGEALPVAAMSVLCGEEGIGGERIWVVCETTKGLLALCVQEAVRMTEGGGTLTPLSGGSSAQLLHLAGEAEADPPLLVIDLEETADALLSE